MIEDYALFGDCETAALVDLEGSIDWLCFPRFDSPACFAALLGNADHGRWRIRPAGEIRHTRRRYREGTLVLETDFETDSGLVTMVDCMPVRDELPDLIRTVEGKRGQVPMAMELVIRFDYGSIVPWVRSTDDGLIAIAGPDALYLHTDVDLRGKDYKTVAEFTVQEGQRTSFVLTWAPSHRTAPAKIDPLEGIDRTERWWREWSGRCGYCGPWKEAVQRSLITLKALTYAPCGGLVAAATTSLPEHLGGARNWDYRYCWLRDATMTLESFISNGYTSEAAAWRDWLVRAVAGEPSKVQIMYGLSGERRLDEEELDWLPGYADSRPVRIGNDAWKQKQIDVYGEIMDAMHSARRSGLEPDENAWKVQLAMLDYLGEHWREPDNGIWEVRGPQLHFTHSRLMAWVAMDRGVKAVESFQLEGPVEQWRQTRQMIHDEVCRKGFNKELNAFVQSYGSRRLDASLLMLPLVGFLPAVDPRVRGTVDAIQQHLTRHGFVDRYTPAQEFDGIPHSEGSFLMCSFWMVQNLAMQGRLAEAQTLFERLLDLRNDVGLLSEEYDPGEGRLLGNFPQAYSHIGLIAAARSLTEGGSPGRGDQ